MTLEPFAERIVETLKELNGMKKVTSTFLAEILLAPARTIRDYLNKLERAGYVYRPYGLRSGWAVAASS
jgi:DeoR/GlpR family transcriptional regulator of sugar metabolism